jgi:hypothetical protein
MKQRLLLRVLRPKLRLRRPKQVLPRMRLLPRLRRQ